MPDAGRPHVGAGSDALLRSILDTAVDAIVTIDVLGEVLTFNQGAERMFGYDADEVIGRNVKMLMPEPYHGEHDGYLRRYDQTRVPRIIGQGREVRGLRRDGSTFPLHLAVSEFEVEGRRLYAGIARDLSSIEAAAEALRTSEETLRRLVEGVADHAIFLLDPLGQVASWNAGAERLLGYADDDVLGRHVRMFHPEADCEAGVPERILATARAEGVAEDSSVRIRADGSSFWANAVVTAMHNDDGSLRGFAKVIRDVSERRAAEAHREEMQAQLLQRQRLETVGQLAGGVAHDFNNLLTVILGAATLLEDAVAPGSAAAADLAQIQQAGERGAALTRQLLTFARQGSVTPRVLDLREVIEGVRELLRRTLGEHVKLQIELPAPVPNVLADAGQIEQVLVNLAVNGRDAMPGGGVLTISVSDVELDDVAVDDLDLAPGRYVRLAVGDTGTGMPPDVAARAFEPFFTTKGQGRGSGLGLATVYGIVSGAGGTARIYTELGMGTVIRIYLPATASDTDAAMPGEPVQHEAAAGTVLLVEDEQGVRHLAERFLRSAGYDVLAAPSGVDALELLDRVDGGVDVVVTDVVMPGLSGRDLVEALRTRLGEVPIVYMSGYTAGVLNAHEGAELDTVLLEKPFTRDGLLDAVRAVTTGEAPAPDPL